MNPTKHRSYGKYGVYTEKISCSISKEMSDTLKKVPTAQFNLSKFIREKLEEKIRKEQWRKNK